MKSIELTKVAIILAFGMVLQTASICMLGLKPDIMLLTECFAIMIVPNKQNTFCVAAVTGFISALTTIVPYGQLPCIVDKFVAAFIFFSLFSMTKNNKFFIFIKLFITAMISSTIFFSMIIYFFGYMQNSILISIFEAIIMSALVTSIAGLILMHVNSKYKGIQSI